MSKSGSAKLLLLLLRLLTLTHLSAWYLYSLLGRKVRVRVVLHVPIRKQFLSVANQTIIYSPLLPEINLKM